MCSSPANLKLLHHSKKSFLLGLPAVTFSPWFCFLTAYFYSSCVPFITWIRSCVFHSSQYAYPRTHSPVLWLSMILKIYSKAFQGLACPNRVWPVLNSATILPTSLLICCAPATLTSLLFFVHFQCFYLSIFVPAAALAWNSLSQFLLTADGLIWVSVSFSPPLESFLIIFLNSFIVI